LPFFPPTIFSGLFFHSLFLCSPSPLCPPPIFHPTASTSSTLTTCWVYCFNLTHYPIHPIPLQFLIQAPSPTTVLHSNTDKGPNTPYPHTSHPFPPYSIPLFLPPSQHHLFNYPSIHLYPNQYYPPQLPLLIDDITKWFSIYYVNNWSGIESVNSILQIYASKSANRNSTLT
jgi:hypothetical protein